LRDQINILLRKWDQMYNLTFILVFSTLVDYVIYK